MNPKTKGLVTVINLILSSLTSFSLVYALASSLRLRYAPLLIFALAFCFLTFYAVLLSKKVYGLAFLAALLVGGAGGMGYLYQKDLLEKALFKVSQFGHWLAQYTTMPTAYNDTFALVVLLLLCALLSLFSYLVTFSRLNFYVTFGCGTFIFAIQFIFNYFVSYSAFYIFLLVVIIYYLKHVQLKHRVAEKKEYRYQAAVSFWAAGIGLTVLFLSVLMPFNANPLQWEWLDSKLNNTYNVFNRVYNNFLFFNSEFTLSRAGFGGGALGGRVRLDNTPVLVVDSPKPLYLRGSARDFYTGYSWINSDSQKPESGNSNGNLLPFRMSQEGNRVRLSDRTPFTSILAGNGSITVTYDNMKTKSLFFPLDAFQLEFLSDMEIEARMDSNGNLSSDKVLGQNFAYTLGLTPLFWNNESIKETLQKSWTGYVHTSLSSRRSYVYDPDGFRYMTSAFITMITPNEDYTHYTMKAPDGSELNNYISPIYTVFNELNEIYSRYRQLPENLPARVGELARSITSGSTNNYDKVKDIEGYLSSNYPYTLMPAPTPMDRDFVDYFLFDLKEGYCTYYASAMTVMVRSLGIPARYVEGYITPPATVSENRYVITNNQAHAWVEVYFEGYGWYSFEPTAPFSSRYYNRPLPSGTISSTFAQEESYEEYVRMLREGYNTPVEDGEAIEASAIPAGTEREGSHGFPLSVLLLVLGMGLCIALPFFHRWRHRTKLAGYYGLAPRNSVLMLYKYYLKVLKLSGTPLKDGETPTRYSARVAGEYSFASPRAFQEITKVFMEARYSGNELAPEAKENVYAFHRELLAKAQEKVGKMRFFLWKYILGRI